MNFGRSPLFTSTALMLLWPAITTSGGEFGTAEEAKAMLARAVTAVKKDERKALAMFNNGASGFKDRDLYVLCAMHLMGPSRLRRTIMGQNLQPSHPAKR